MVVVGQIQGVERLRWGLILTLVLSGNETGKTCTLSQSLSFLYDLLSHSLGDAEKRRVGSSVGGWWELCVVAFG